MRTHIAQKHLDFESLSNREQDDDKWAMKPKGLWYDFNGEWEAWCSSEMPDWVEDIRKYSIEVCTTDLLVIKTVKMLKEFTHKYKRNDLPEGLMSQYIDWRKVAKEYKGIEIPKYLPEARFDLEVFWYYSWDVASGVVWDVSAIKKIKEL